MEITHSRTEHESRSVQIKIKVLKEDQSQPLGETTANTLVEHLRKLTDEKDTKLSEANIRLVQLENKVEYLTRKLQCEEEREAKEAKGEVEKHVKKLKHNGNMSNRRVGQSCDISSSSWGNQNSDGNSGNCSDWYNFKNDRNGQNRRAPTDRGRQQNLILNRKTNQYLDSSKPSSHGNQSVTENHTDQQNLQSDGNFRYRKQRYSSETLSVQKKRFFTQQSSSGYRQCGINRRTGQSWDNFGPNSHRNQNVGENHTDLQNFRRGENFRYKNQQDSSENLSDQNNWHFPQQSGPGYRQFKQTEFVNKCHRTGFRNNPQESPKSQSEAGNFRNLQSLDREVYISIIKKILTSQYFWTLVAIVKGAIYRLINQWTVNYK